MADDNLRDFLEIRPLLSGKDVPRFYALLRKENASLLLKTAGLMALVDPEKLARKEERRRNGTLFVEYDGDTVERYYLAERFEIRIPGDKKPVATVELTERPAFELYRLFCKDHFSGTLKKAENFVPNAMEAANGLHRIQQDHLFHWGQPQTPLMTKYDAEYFARHPGLG